MKLLRLSALAIGLILIAQPKIHAQHEIKTNVLGIIITDYNLQYEYVTEDMGFLMGVSYFNSGSIIGDDSYTTFRLTPEFRYYFNPDEDASGFFASGYLRYRNATGEDWYVTSDFDPVTGNTVETSYDLKNTGVAFGFTLGYKWVTRSGLVFETFGGLGRYLINETSYDPDLPENDPLIDIFDELPQFDVRFGFAIGYRID